MTQNPDQADSFSPGEFAELLAQEVRLDDGAESPEELAVSDMEEEGSPVTAAEFDQLVAAAEAEEALEDMIEAELDDLDNRAEALLDQLDEDAAIDTILAAGGLPDDEEVDDEDEDDDDDDWDEDDDGDADAGPVDETGAEDWEEVDVVDEIRAEVTSEQIVMGDGSEIDIVSQTVTETIVSTPK